MNETVKQLNLGQTKDEIIAILGQPKKTYDRDQYEILQYGSIAPSLADLLYFEKNTLVLKEMSVKKDNLVLNSLIALYGNPSSRYKLYSDEFEDSFSTTVYAWFGEGVDAIVFGELGDSQILNIRYFAPQTEQEYESSFGKQWADRQIFIKEEQKELVSSSQLQLTQEEVVAIRQLETDLAKAKGAQQLAFIVSTFVLIFLLFAVAIFFFKRKRAKKNQEINNGRADSMPL